MRKKHYVYGETPLQKKFLWSLVVLLTLMGVGCIVWSWAILVGFILGIGCGLLVAFNEMALKQTEFHKDFTEDEE